MCMKYYERVFVTLFIQHGIRMRCHMYSSVASLLLSYFSLNLINDITFVLKCCNTVTVVVSCYEVVSPLPHC